MAESPDTRIAKHTKTIESPQASSQEKCQAYVSRGNAHSEKGLYVAAITDYSAALAFPDVRLLEAGTALLNRGAMYGFIGRQEEEIADYSYIIDRPDFAAFFRRCSLQSRGRL